MLKTIALIGFGAAIAFTPLPTIAQTYSAAPVTHHVSAHKPTYGSEIQRRSNLSTERARASAHHMRHMRQMQHKPATTP
jgi:hypothetical protein